MISSSSNVSNEEFQVSLRDELKKFNIYISPGIHVQNFVAGDLESVIGPGGKSDVESIIDRASKCEQDERVEEFVSFVEEAMTRTKKADRTEGPLRHPRAPEVQGIISPGKTVPYVTAAVVAAALRKSASMSFDFDF